MCKCLFVSDWHHLGLESVFWSFLTKTKQDQAPPHAMVKFSPTSLNFGYPARALRALGCYWQTVPPQWEGGRLFDRSAGFFYGNSCNSRTESRKIVSKVGN